MANVADVAPVPGQTQAQPPARTSVRGLFAQTEIDSRLFGMLIAFVLIRIPLANAGDPNEPAPPAAIM